VPVRADVADLSVLSAALDVAAYRIVAEAIANAVRHARASAVVVSVRVRTGRLGIAVSDDGRGLPADPVHGLGLTSMRFRAEELGGEFTLTSSAAGTSVLALIPIAPQETDANSLVLADRPTAAVLS
jgi:two-component system, NarL family, sensor kinase